LPVIVVGCEIFFLTVCHLWHWLWSVLGLWVLVLQIAIVFAFLFCKDEDKKSKNGGKMNDTGKLMVVTVIITAIVSYFIGVWSLPTPIESVKHGITSKLHLFGDSLPEENVAMRAAVVKYLQDNLQDDIHGQQFLLKVAENASHFNQTLDGKTALRRKVGGREKIGLMGVDECVWAEVGNGTPLAGSPEQNLEAAMVLYKTYGRIPWSMNVRFITRHSKTFSVPATGWSAEVPIGARLDYLRPSEAVQLATDKDVEFRVDPDNSNWDLPQKTSWVKYRALSGKPTVVLATPSSELR
jgi:heme/copper-type cytochrome/quinol oxidase subunit 2